MREAKINEKHFRVLRLKRVLPKGIGNEEGRERD